MKNKFHMRNRSHIRKKPTFSHDSFFKHFYSDPKLAQELLQLIFSKKELSAYDLQQLKIEKDSFEDKRVDLIFSIPFKVQPKIKLELLVLLEHKSFHDKNLFSQLLKYQVLVREHSIQQRGYPQPIIPVLFYHGKQPLKWRRSLQEEDFKSLFSKIPVESRKHMLNYELKIINTQDSKVREAYKGHQLKGRGVIRLLSEVWSIKKPTPLKVKEVFTEFEDILKKLKGKKKEEMSLRIVQYLIDNTGLDFKTWKEAEELMIEEGILTRGGVMDIREFIKEQGRWEGRQQLILNMLKKKVDIAFISEVTGLSEKEIKKLKNGSDSRIAGRR